MKKFEITKRSTTNEDYQLVKELLPYCKKTVGVDFYDSDGNLQLILSQSGRIISKAIILTVKLTRHHYRDWVEEKINLLFVKHGSESIEVHNLSRSDLSAKNLERILGFSSGLYFSPILDDIILALIEEQLCFKGSKPAPIEDKYHFSGRDPEKVQYICQDGTLLEPLNSISSESLIKVPDRVSVFKLLSVLLCVAPNYIAIYILALRALASILSSPALEGKQKPSFGIILLGETGSKKTSLVKALCYMDEQPYNAVNFKWTPAAVQEKLKDVQDDILFCDDSFPGMIHEERKNQRKILSMLVRATGDDIGTSQKMQGSTVTANTASSLFIITGEQLVPCSESDIWRTFIPNIRKDDVDKDALTWLQEHPDVIRFYSRLFIQWFPLNDDRVAKLYEDYISTRTTIRDRKPELPDRLVSNCAWLEAAVLTIYDFLNEMASVQSPTDEDHTILTDWIHRHFPSCLDNIKTVVSHQYGRYGNGGDTDTATFAQIMEVIKKMREEGMDLFTTLAKGERGIDIAPAPDKASGFYWSNDDSYVYLRTDALMGTVGEYCRDHGDIDFTAPSGKAFRSMLVQNGLFVKQQHGKNRTKELSVNGIRYKVTVVFRDELEKWIGSMEQK